MRSEKVRDGTSEDPTMTIPTSKDINNRIAALKGAHLDGRSETEAFIRDLQPEGPLGAVWHSRTRVDSEGRLNGIVIVHKKALSLARRNSTSLS